MHYYLPASSSLSLAFVRIRARAPPSAVNRRSPAAVDRRSPTTVDRRLPAAVDRRLPAVVDRRSCVLSILSLSPARPTPTSSACRRRCRLRPPVRLPSSSPLSSVVGGAAPSHHSTVQLLAPDLPVAGVLRSTSTAAATAVFLISRSGHRRRRFCRRSPVVEKVKPMEKTETVEEVVVVRCGGGRRQTRRRRPETEKMKTVMEMICRGCLERGDDR